MLQNEEPGLTLAFPSRIIPQYRWFLPPEYLQANLDLLKRNVALAVAYGLTPGLTVCSPRTMPEAFFARYPYLRGARVDHPYRSYRPRYTATLSHPVVRWHYAQLMRAMMREERSRGLTDCQVHALVVLPSDPRVLLAGTLSRGLFRSTDSGDTWVHVTQDSSQVWGLSVRSQAK